MLGKALLVWCVQLVTIVLLGGLRDKLLRPHVGEQIAHQAGTSAACVAVFLLVCGFMDWLAPESAFHALGLGLFWVVLAIGFEFGFFHLVMKVPWGELLADYNILRGRLLPLLWLTVLFSPLCCFFWTVE